MASERQHHDASSDDSVFDQVHAEKLNVDAPASEQLTETPVVMQPDNDAESVQDKSPGGVPLDRTPSQAARMGKKKIIAVMTALCVSILRRDLHLSKMRGEIPK
jgi:hypothetical protein